MSAAHDTAWYSDENNLHSTTFCDESEDYAESSFDFIWYGSCWLAKLLWEWNVNLNFHMNLHKAQRQIESMKAAEPIGVGELRQHFFSFHNFSEPAWAATVVPHICIAMLWLYNYFPESLVVILQPRFSPFFHSFRVWHNDEWKKSSCNL